MKKIFTPVIILSFLTGTCSVFAYEMSSDNYRIWEGSINVGGSENQTSTSYKLRESIGEPVVGTATSTSYKLKMGYQPMLESYISLSLSTTSVQMLPSIGGLSGGNATGTFSATVITDNPGGYSLYVNASNSPALTSGSYSFADYTLAGADPDYSWSVNSDASEFGFSPEGADIIQKFKDNGTDTCATSTNDTADKCWHNFSTSNEQISKVYSSNHPLGVATTIKLQAESGADNLQEEGSYQAVITATAVAN